MNYERKTVKSRVLYDSIRSKKRLNIFIILTRFLIGFAFIPSGLKKLLGLRFTQLGIDTGIGFFFEGLYRAGLYWNFLGAGQLLAAFLLMTQRFATAGALIYFFIISNIWVITVTMGFKGTWVITTLMLLASILLLVWDYDKIKYLFYPDGYTSKDSFKSYPGYNKTWIIAGFILFILSIAGSLLLESSNSLFRITWFVLILLTVLLAYLIDLKHSRIKTIAGTSLPPQP